MELQLFVSKKLAINFYYSLESINNDVVKVENLCVVFPGLPNFIDKDFFATHVDKNTAYFSVNYFGSWLSGGKFTPVSARDSINLAIKFAQKGVGVKTFDGKKIQWKYKNLYVIGYSFAGNSVLTSNINKKDITAVLLYAPLIYLHRTEISKIINAEKASKFYGFNNFFLEFLKRGYSFALRGIGDASWQKYFSGNDLMSEIKLTSDYPYVYLFHGTKDDQVDPVFSVYFNKNHKNISQLHLIENAGHTKELFELGHLKKVKHRDI